MSVALIDQDCLNNKKDFFFDLDIMKLASYYKSKKEITKLLLKPSEYFQYTQTYFIKNRFDYKLFGQIFKDPRITYRGYAFSASQYEPLPDDIEHAPADFSVYDTYIKFNDKLAQRREAKILTSAMAESCHARLSINGTNCNVEDKYIIYKDTESLNIYDYNMFDLSDWKERLPDFKQYLLRFKFPPMTNSLDDLISMIQDYRIISENHFIVSGHLDDVQINEIITLGKTYKDRIRVSLLEDLNPYDNTAYVEEIIYSMNTILALKNAHVRVHAYINPRNIDERTAFLNNIAYWSNRNHSDCSFHEFVHCIRGQAIDRIDKLMASNEELNYLYNVIPSKWRKSR